MKAQDEAFLIKFSDRAELAVGFTSRPIEVAGFIRDKAIQRRRRKVDEFSHRATSDRDKLSV
jgi:hypothetical protein